MELIHGSETSAFNNNQTPGKYPEELLSLLQHGESLKHRIIRFCLHLGGGHKMYIMLSPQQLNIQYVQGLMPQVQD